MRKGFTLVELLLVITIIGVLSGVVLSVLNVEAQKDHAKDAVRRSNLEKVIEGINAMYASEGEYPENELDVRLSTYVTAWPDGNPSGAVYSYYVDSTKQVFGLSVETSRPSVAYKYRSDWGKIQECSDSDPSSWDCDGGYYP